MTTSSQVAPEFLRLDPDLPSIAAMAAVEVDAIINHKEHSKVRNVLQLADVLSRTFQNSPQDHGRRFLLDPVCTRIFTKSISESHNKSLTSYNDLANISAELAKQMRNIDDLGDERLLQLIKSFCLALSRYALASKGRIDEFTGTPSFRR